MSGFIGIVVGMTAEARLARLLRGDIRIATGGGTSAGAAEAAARLIADGAKGLLSLGLAAGLVPEARPGYLMVPDHVVLRGDAGLLQRLGTDAALAAMLGGALPGLGLLHSDVVVADAAAKRALAAETGCRALDMESGAVARAATRAGLPFAVLRAVCDPAERSLPPAALVALTAGGRVGIGRVTASILRHPEQVPALIELGRDAARAKAALRDSLANFTLS